MNNCCEYKFLNTANIIFLQLYFGIYIFVSKRNITSQQTIELVGYALFHVHLNYNLKIVVDLINIFTFDNKLFYIFILRFIIFFHPRAGGNIQTCEVF